MSKHSKWSKIKNQKAVTDVRKGKIFTKMGLVIAVAARHGGDPATNLQLRLAIDKARAANVPKETIERAIQKSAGGSEGAVLEETLYEGFGPGGIAVLVECLADNKNRAMGAVKKVFAEHGGTLGGSGSVAWMFTRRGVVRSNPLPSDSAKRDTIELALIEAGADDVDASGEGTEILTSIENLQTIKTTAEKNGLMVSDASIEWIAKETLPLDPEKEGAVSALIDALDELDDVQNVFSNLS